jgi:hypothetical protein
MLCRNHPSMIFLKNNADCRRPPFLLRAFAATASMWFAPVMSMAVSVTSVKTASTISPPRTAANRRRSSGWPSISIWKGMDSVRSGGCSGFRMSRCSTGFITLANRWSRFENPKMGPLTLSKSTRCSASSSKKKPLLDLDRCGSRGAPIPRLRTGFARRADRTAPLGADRRPRKLLPRHDRPLECLSACDSVERSYCVKSPNLHRGRL